MTATWAVVLAGGGSRRFGADKLSVTVDGRPLLERVLADLPAGLTIVVVGPSRPTLRPVSFVREHPAGGGPTAALVAGLSAALAGGATEILVLPADAPGGPAAARLLRADLHRQDEPWAVTGLGSDGRVQPLQLALSRPAAQALVGLAGPVRGAGESARRLLTRLVPPASTAPLPAATTWDIDTPEQLLAWSRRDTPAVRRVLAAATRCARTPVVVALDGPSGAGKSTLATALVIAADAVIVHGDDFYSPRLTAMPADRRAQLTDAEVAAEVIDVGRLRVEALEPLRGRRSTTYRPYDWEHDDGRLGAEVRLGAAPLIVVEGVYSGRPELADLIDVAGYVDVEPAERADRLARRRSDRPEWTTLWERGERHYFGAVRPPSSFDLLLRD